VIIGLHQSEIVAWNYTTNATVFQGFGNEIVNTVACSPVDPTNFVAGGSQGTTSKFTFFTYDGNSIVVAKDITTVPNSGPEDACWTADGSQVYRVGNDGVIYYYDASTY